ncbi:unnamed protein product [Strongylus vulgaris]|uniref:Uncharacterized protein n=1 Tax=Strongylus vulgaris TaxID=40348 RepID=A0A3P7IG04_STRVU|nr:unnamed protein product [Strongylus vulgaris]
MAKEATDTFLNTTGWGKGILAHSRTSGTCSFFSVKKYYSILPTQHTLYVPADFVRAGSNTLMLMELEGTKTCQKDDCTVSFIDHPVFVWEKIYDYEEWFRLTIVPMMCGAI